MKKLLYCAAALSAVLFAGSCQRENLEPVVNGGVTYTITLPETVQTKGENGYAEYDLYYEVYKTLDPTATGVQLLFQNNEPIVMTDETYELTLDLLNDQDYTVLFWANKKGTAYFNTEDLRNVAILAANSNDDDRDAFCGMDQLEKHDGAQAKTVELKRPFAQVNIATLVNKVDYNIHPQTSYVKFTKIPVAYNVFTGKPVGETAEVEYGVENDEHIYTTIPADSIDVNGVKYKYVAMNYVLVPEANIDVYYEIVTANGTVSNTINNVPVKKNYRTNIIGNLLTSNATYTVELKPGFEEGAYYGPEFVKEPAYDETTKTWTITSRDELLYVAQQVNTGANSFEGQTVKVVNNIDLKNIPWTPIGYSTTVTFKGMFEGAAITKSETEYPTISNLKIENGNCSGFFGLMCNGGKVRNINFNNVTISGERQLGVVVGQVYGNLEQPTIENVTVENAVITAVPALEGAVYDNGDKVGGIAGLIGGKAYIKDCTVKNSTFTGYRDLGGILGSSQNGEACKLTGNHSENINFVVTSQYVPYKNNTPHGATGAIRGGTRSNAGDVIEDNTSSDGTISAVVIVNDQVSFQNAINAAAGITNIKFGNDINGNVTVIQKPGVKISVDGDNKKYNGFIKVHSNSNHYADAALTIKNVNFETSTVYYDSDNEPYFNFIEALENGSERYSTNITVDGCTFTATGDAVNETVALQIKASKNAKALNCTATGLHSLVQAQSCDETVVVKECTIEEGKNGVAFKQVKAATVEGTTINATGYGIRFDGNTDNYGITVKNITVSAAQPLIVRKMTGQNNTITLEGTNTLTTEAEYQIVITNDSDDKPYVKPTGTYTLTGEDGFTIFPRPILAKVGNTEFDIIDEAIAAWTNNTTLTLLANVTLNDVIKIKSTEHHILDLGTYTMTAKSKQNAIEITCEGQSKETYALTVNADVTNPGGITASGKACIYYYKQGTTQDRPMICVNNGVFTGSYSINVYSSNRGTNCPTVLINNGIFNSYMSVAHGKLRINGGIFHGAINCTGDSTAYREIRGGRFKSWQYMTGDASNKFWVGTAKETYDVGCYVDDEGYLVVGGPVITEFDDRFEAKAKIAAWSSYLKYSSAANGLYYTKKDNIKKSDNILELNPNKTFE